MAILLEDSYNESNKDTSTIMKGVAGNYTQFGQAFTATNSENLYSAKFYLRKSGSPVGNATAKLYAITGMYGTNAKPTGAALATSDPIDASTLSTSDALVEFFFTGGNAVALTATTQYAVLVDYSGTASVLIGYDTTSPSHSGNAFGLVDGSYSTYSTIDTAFYVYTDSGGGSSTSSSPSASPSTSPSPSASASNSPSTSPSAPPDQATDITYEIQIDTANTFDSQAGSPLLDKLSATNPGFTDITNPLDVDPFATDDQVAYTVQAGDALADGTYYWRVRGKDPLGSNTWGDWSETWVFTLGAATVVQDLIMVGIIPVPR